MRRSVRISFLGGLTMGAALVYFLDPLQGRRRREVTRERTRRGWGIAKEIASQTSSDIARSTHGARCRVRSLLGYPSAEADLLAHRVRSRLEGMLSNSRGIEITSDDGFVTLRGAVRPWEMGPLLAEAGRVRGVRGLINHLEIDAGGDALSGIEETVRHAARPQSWSPATRLLVAAAGTGAFVRGRRTGGVEGLLWTTLGLAALARSVSNADVRRMTGLGRRILPVTAPIESRDPFLTPPGPVRAPGRPSAAGETRPTTEH